MRIFFVELKKDTEMKRISTILLLFSLALTTGGCEYDDGELWRTVDELDGRVEALETAAEKANADIVSLQGLVAALRDQVTVESVEKTADGYTITFSKGEPVTIRNGRDGIDAPAVAVRQDTDGVWYWTLGGEWLTDAAGDRVRASAEDGAPGAPGKDAVAPRVRINADTKEWEISADNGLSWTSTGVRAEGTAGSAGDSLFRSVNTDDPDRVIFTLQDGSIFSLPRSGGLAFVIEGLGSSPEHFRFGTTRTWPVVAKGVADFTISKPDGWKVACDGEVLSVTAPAAENGYADTQGEIAVHAVSATGFSRIVKMRVEAAAYELRVLTFEDEDYKGTGNFLGHRDWSSLVDSKQYNGPLLYPETEELYRWDDSGNTFLASVFTNNWGDYKFWGGGHALSNYVSMDLDGASFSTQLSVYHTDPVTGQGGHNGSKNFCVHNGYVDRMNPGALPSIYFMDGVARVVDHLWVMNTTYVLNSVLKGDGYSTDPFGQGDFLKIVATGYDAEGNPVAKTSEFLLAHDTEHVSAWTRWDLSSLGAVLMIEFNITGSRVGDYGLNTPAYFAYDDVAVRF